MDGKRIIMSEETQYKYEGLKVPYSPEGTFSIAKWPKAVGYWVLYPGAFRTSFAMYKKPNRIQIWFTEKLLGWKWEDAK
jgi:hypothetical protein